MQDVLVILIVRLLPVHTPSCLRGLQGLSVRSRGNPKHLLEGQSKAGHLVCPWFNCPSAKVRPYLHPYSCLESLGQPLDHKLSL